MPRPSSTHRRTVTWIAGGVFAFATAVVVGVLTVSSTTSGAASILIGPFDERSLLTLSVLVALASLCIGLWSIDPPRRMRPLKIAGVVLAAGASAIAVFLAALIVEANVTPVLHGGCDTGYVVIERSFLMGSSGIVYRQDGPLIVTQVARSSGDDGYQPFSMGGYTVTEAEGTLTVDYAVNRPIDSTGVTGGSGSSIVLPVLEDRTPRCGLQAAGDPGPTPGRATPSSEPSPVTMKSIDDDMREIVEDSLAAASGAVVDASGTPIEASTLSLSAAPCAEGPGTRRELQLEFRTDDNTRSIERILAVWDRAGYERDRAMHEDIRYSETLPVARMSIKDTSSVDGLIHLTSTSICVPSS